MVSTLAVVCMVISLLLCVAVPITAMVVVCKKTECKFIAVAAGIIGFLVMQLFIRMSVLQYLTYAGYMDILAQNFLLYILVLAVSAAVCETFARWATMKLMLRGKLSYHSSMAHGIGHGGIEAVTLVGFTMAANLVVLLMANSNTASPGIDTAVSTLASVQPYEFLLGGIERVLTMCVQIGLSVMVALGIVTKRRRWIWIAIGFHTALDFFAVLLAQMVGTVAAEILIAVFAALAIIFIVKAKGLFESMQSNTPDALSQAYISKNRG